MKTRQHVHFTCKPRQQPVVPLCPLRWFAIGAGTVAGADDRLIAGEECHHRHQERQIRQQLETVAVEEARDAPEKKVERARGELCRGRDEVTPEEAYGSARQYSECR